VSKEYITSERFIWDELLAKAAFAAGEVRKKWQKKRKIPTMVLSWPTVTIKDDKGKSISKIVSLEVPAEVPLTRALRDLAVRTKAYALLVCTASKDELRVVLESHHGVRCWTTPISKHGDVSVLGETKVVDDQGGYDLLWKKRMGSG